MKQFFVAVALAVVAAIPSGPAVAQCAGCGADYNRADREQTDREAARQDRADTREHMGDGMLRDAAEKAESHNERNERALRDTDPN